MQEKLVCLLFCIFLPFNSLAEGALTSDEKDVIAISKGSIAMQGSWAKSRLLNEAKEEFRRAGLFMRCDAAAHPEKSPLLQPRYRLMLESFTKRWALNIDRNRDDADVQRYFNRPAIWAYAKLDPLEVKNFLKSSKENNDIFLKLLSTARVLNAFAQMTTDVSTGSPEPAAVVWLVEYLRLEGTYEIFKSALEKRSREAASNLDKVLAIEKHSVVDADWLIALGKGVEDNVFESESLMLSSQPLPIQESYQEWRKNPFFDLVQKAQIAIRNAQVNDATRAMNPLADSQKQSEPPNGIAIEINLKFPRPESLATSTEKPAFLLAKPEIDHMCPSQAK